VYRLRSLLKEMPGRLHCAGSGKRQKAAALPD